MRLAVHQDQQNGQSGENEGPRLWADRRCSGQAERVGRVGGGGGGRSWRQGPRAGNWETIITRQARDLGQRVIEPIYR